MFDPSAWEITRAFHDDGGREVTEKMADMGSRGAVILSVVLLVAVVVAVDVLFFRGRFWERLIANIGIVLIFAAFYLRFLKRP